MNWEKILAYAGIILVIILAILMILRIVKVI